jgi:hypothetical protein
MIFLVSAATMLGALVAFVLMPEKTLRGYASESAPIIAE